MQNNVAVFWATFIYLFIYFGQKLKQLKAANGCKSLFSIALLLFIFQKYNVLVIDHTQETQILQGDSMSPDREQN